jgi:hypothetical protein
MNAKSLRVPSRLRFLVFPKVMADILERSSANVVRRDTDSAQVRKHRVGKDRIVSRRLASRIRMMTERRECSLMNRRCC